MKYLVVGLGNIGPEYQHTRHNIGFKVLDAFAKASNAVFEDVRYGAVATLRLKGRSLILLKPNTYMNLSGKAVSYWMQREKIELSNVLVVVDDLALPFGTIRLRGQGSDGGHNGLKNINDMLGTQAYARLRMGIGNDFPRGHQVDYVLGRWTEEEEEKLPVMLKFAEEVVKSVVFVGVAKTMNLYNNSKLVYESREGKN